MFERHAFSAGSLLPSGAVGLQAQSHEGHVGPSTIICRPQRERRPPRKLADAAELCDTMVEPSGERLLTRQKPNFKCDATLYASYTSARLECFIAGHGANRSATEALHGEAMLITGQLQRASEHPAAATSLRSETTTEINLGGSYLPGAYLHGPLCCCWVQSVTFYAHDVHFPTGSHARAYAQGCRNCFTKARRVPQRGRPSDSTWHVRRLLQH